MVSLQGLILWKIMSESRTNEAQFKTKMSPKLKMLESLRNQTVNQKTDAKILYDSIYWY